MPDDGSAQSITHRRKQHGEVQDWVSAVGSKQAKTETIGRRSVKQDKSNNNSNNGKSHPTSGEAIIMLQKEQTRIITGPRAVYVRVLRDALSYYINQGKSGTIGYSWVQATTIITRECHTLYALPGFLAKVYYIRVRCRA